MAFWGVEVKPGKPFTHLPGNTRERLRLSQATLGFGTATSKSVVQCNVGNRSPVFLCSLFPEKSESCQLNLEFEEADEVVFSVIGPRSVHLTGYYLGASRHLKLDDESESYGEDIVDTETERSPGVSDEEYEDSFIDDDDELLAIPPSPAFFDGAEETSREGRKKDTKSKHRRLRKTYQLSESDEDMAVISSLIKSDATEGKTNAIDSEMKRKPHEDDHTLPSTVVNNSKPKKKEKKQPKEREVRARVEDEFFSGQTLTWDKTHQNKKKEKTGNKEGEKLLHLSLPSDEIVHGIVAKPVKKKKKQAKEEKSLGVVIPLNNVSTEDQAEQNMDENVVSDWPPALLGLATLQKPKQKRKRTAKDKALEEDKANVDEQSQMQTTKADFENNDEQSDSENHNRKKKKKKK